MLATRKAEVSGHANLADPSAPARNCTSILRLRTAACTTLTPRELGKRLHHAGAAPAPAVWKTAMRAATSMMLDWWLNSELRRTLLGFSEALICLSYSALKLVPPRGNAPRSISNRLMALLLSYGGYCHKKSPVKVTLPRVPGVGRARCYYANGRKVVTASGLSPDRAELRTRVREMLCICGGCDGNWRSTRESHSGRF